MGSEAGASGSVTVLLSGIGPLEITLQTGEMAGEVSGAAGSYQMTGSVVTTNTAELTVIGFRPRPTTVTESVAMDSPLENVIVLCQDIQGRWDFQIRSSIEEVGFDEFVRGYFSASTGVDPNEQASDVESLLTRPLPPNSLWQPKTC